jgi:hypothetical protein
MKVCAQGWWAFCKSARGVHQAQTSEGDVMKTLIRVVKRRSEDNRDDTAAARLARPQLTTEMIIKSWIIESRERRQAALSQLQTSIGWKELGGSARG